MSNTAILDIERNDPASRYPRHDGGHQYPSIEEALKVVRSLDRADLRGWTISDADTFEFIAREPPEIG